MNPRTFPGPWRVEASEGAFVVTDAKGFAVAYLYWKPQPALHDRFIDLVLYSVTQEQRTEEMFKRRFAGLPSISRSITAFFSLSCVLVPLQEVRIPGVVRNDTLRHHDIRFQVHSQTIVPEELAPRGRAQTQPQAFAFWGFSIEGPV